MVDGVGHTKAIKSIVFGGGGSVLAVAVALKVFKLGFFKHRTLFIAGGLIGTAVTYRWLNSDGYRRIGPRRGHRSFALDGERLVVVDGDGQQRVSVHDFLLDLSTRERSEAPLAHLLRTAAKGQFDLAGYVKFAMDHLEELHLQSLLDLLGRIEPEQLSDEKATSLLSRSQSIEVIEKVAEMKPDLRGQIKLTTPALAGDRERVERLLALVGQRSEEQEWIARILCDNDAFEEGGKPRHLLAARRLGAEKVAAKLEQLGVEVEPAYHQGEGFFPLAENLDRAAVGDAIEQRLRAWKERGVVATETDLGGIGTMDHLFGADFVRDVAQRCDVELRSPAVCLVVEAREVEVEAFGAEFRLPASRVALEVWRGDGELISVDTIERELRLKMATFLMQVGLQEEHFFSLDENGLRLSNTASRHLRPWRPSYETIAAFLSLEGEDFDQIRQENDKRIAAQREVYRQHHIGGPRLIDWGRFTFNLEGQR